MALFSKDGTAQGVAKIRHYESLFPAEEQLYYDPYAYAMFSGSYIQDLMGPNVIRWLYRLVGLGGLIEMISARTRWLDDQIIVARKEQLQKKDVRNGQLIILGAGYDTRGFRLVDLWNGDDSTTSSSTSSFHVIEVDQPEVQEKKMGNMKWLMTKETNDATNSDSNNKHHSISHLVESKKVSFLPVNFVTDNLQEKLTSHEQFSQNTTTTLSIITMEGVTQYIPKESTADTLKKIHNIVTVGSTLLITYVDQDCFGHDDDDTSSSAPSSQLYIKAQKIMKLTSKVGEPWITGFTPVEFASFLQECGYQVQSDTTVSDYNLEYFGMVGRKLSEEEMIGMERFVLAKAV